MAIISPFARQSHLFWSSPWVSGCCWSTKLCNYAVCVQIAILIVSLLDLSVRNSSPCPLGYLPACDCSLHQKSSEHSQRRCKTIALSADLHQFVTAVTHETLYFSRQTKFFHSVFASSATHIHKKRLCPTAAICDTPRSRFLTGFAPYLRDVLSTSLVGRVHFLRRTQYVARAEGVKGACLSYYRNS